ncbi:serine hydrolase [Ancylomarina sp. 16SWW S1-10-2]|uniref:serine hydrolase domain-containing protein n=1 Tax=Ancylomarina sp. 16SWW S1-10-2 TaxID=2499681 RepID=UPI00189DFE9B|nr:serine hydrolase domain-containing protein [Ancylomarina sp. 16SWW S1-10-2]
MTIKQIIILVLTLVFVLLDTHTSSSKGEEARIPYDSKLAPVSHRISNELSSSDATKKADYRINRFLEYWRIEGASVAIVKNEKLVFAKGYGYADVDKKEKVEPDHLFRIASVSKLITATAIMKLKEEGKLQLSDRVFGEDGILNSKNYLTIHDKRAKKITVENLLRHTSGFSSRYGDQMFMPLTIAKKMDVPTPVSAETIIEFALSKRLNFAPGSRGSYSNLGYVILGKIVEKASGKDYEAYVQEHILQPAGIFDMHIGRNLRIDKLPNEVNYYEQSNAILVSPFDGSGGKVNRSNGGNNIEELGGAGAWIASAAELMKFYVAIDGKDKQADILSKESIAYMTKPSPRGFSPIGWKGTLSNGTWWRTGTLAGTSALLKQNPDGTTWVIITNTSSWKGSKFPKDLNKLMRRVMRSVKKWPETDLFNYFEAQPNELAFDDITEFLERS